MVNKKAPFLNVENLMHFPKQSFEDDVIHSRSKSTHEKKTAMSAGYD